MRQGRRLRASRTGSVAVALAFAGACSSTQQIPLPCITQEMRVYVDGRLLEGELESIELGIDAPHKLFVKRPGHEPQLVVLVPEQTSEGIRLVPEDVCAELVQVGLDRELTVEVDDDSDTGR